LYIGLRDIAQGDLTKKITFGHRSASKQDFPDEIAAFCELSIRKMPPCVLLGHLGRHPPRSVPTTTRLPRPSLWCLGRLAIHRGRKIALGTHG
jgi:hypothetical protein